MRQARCRAPDAPVPGGRGRYAAAGRWSGRLVAGCLAAAALLGTRAGATPADAEVVITSPPAGAVLTAVPSDVFVEVRGVASCGEITSFEVNGEQKALAWTGGFCAYDGPADFSGPYAMEGHRTLVARAELSDGSIVSGVSSFVVVASDAERHRIGDAVNGAWARFRNDSAGLFEELLQEAVDALLGSDALRDAYLAAKAERRNINAPGTLIVSLFLLGGILGVLVSPVFLVLFPLLAVVLLVSSVEGQVDLATLDVQALEVELDLQPTVGCAEDILAPVWGGGPLCNDLEPGELFDYALCPPPDHHPGSQPPSPFPGTRDGFRVGLWPELAFEVNLVFHWFLFGDEHCSAQVDVNPGTYFRGLVTPAVGPDPLDSDPRAAWHAGLEIAMQDAWSGGSVDVAEDCTAPGGPIHDQIRSSLRDGLDDALCDPFAFRIAFDQAIGPWDVRGAEIPVPPGTYLSVHHRDGAWSVPLGLRVASDQVPASEEPFALGSALGSGPLDPFVAGPTPPSSWDVGLALSDAALNSLLVAAFDAGDFDRITGGGVQIDLGTTSLEVELGFGAPPTVRITGDVAEVDVAGLHLRVLEEQGGQSSVLLDAVLGALLEAQVVAGPAGRLWLAGFRPADPYLPPDWIRTLVVLEGSGSAQELEDFLETFVIGPVVVPALREALFAIRPPALGSDLSGVAAGPATRQLLVSDAAFLQGWAYLYLDIAPGPPAWPPVKVLGIAEPVRLERGAPAPAVRALCYRDPDGDAISGSDSVDLGYGLRLVRESTAPATERECWKLAGTVDPSASPGLHQTRYCITDSTGRSSCGEFGIYVCTDPTCPAVFDGVPISPPNDAAQHLAVDVEDDLAVLQHWDAAAGTYGLEFVDLSGLVPVRVEGPIPDTELPGFAWGAGPSALVYFDWSPGNERVVHRDLSGPVPAEVDLPDGGVGYTPLQPLPSLVGWKNSSGPHAIRLCSPDGNGGFGVTACTAGYDEYPGVVDLAVFSDSGITATPFGILFHGRETLLANKTWQGLRLLQPSQGSLATYGVVGEWDCTGANCGPPSEYAALQHYRYSGDGELIYARAGEGTIEGCHLGSSGRCSRPWAVPLEDGGAALAIDPSAGSFDASEDLVAFLSDAPPELQHIYVYDRTSCTLNRLTATASADRMRYSLATSGRWVVWVEAAEDGAGNLVEAVLGAEVPLGPSRCGPIGPAPSQE